MCLTATSALRSGFTLIEMMVTLGIAGIIFLVVLPAWQDALIKSYRAAGRGALLDVLSRQEQYLINNQRYAEQLPELGLPAPYYVDMQAQPVDAARAIYKIELVFDALSYTGARAIPQHRQGRDQHCMTLAISRTGVRSVSGSFSRSPHHCW